MTPELSDGDSRDAQNGVSFDVLPGAMQHIPSSPTDRHAMQTSGSPSQAEQSGTVGIWLGGTIGSGVEMKDVTDPKTGITKMEEVSVPGMFSGEDFNHLFGPQLGNTHLQWHVPAEFPEKGIDSTNMTENQMHAIAKLVYKLMMSRHTEGIVIAHGTDTMANTAQYLSYAFPTPRVPVVLTGSQIRPGDPQTDAIKNVALALRVARENAAEIMLAFNGKVFRGSSVQKNRAIDIDAFNSPHEPPLAQLVGTHLKHSLQPDQFRTRATYFDGTVPFYPGLSGSCRIVEMSPSLNDPQAIRKECEGYEGVIIKGYAAGNMPERIQPTLDKLAQDAVIIIVPSAETEGERETLYETSPAVGNSATLFARGMLASAAHTKFRWLHAQKTKAGILDPKKGTQWIRERFLMNFGGDATGARLPEISNHLLLKHAVTSKIKIASDAAHKAPESEKAHLIVDAMFKERMNWLRKKVKEFDFKNPQIEAEWISQRSGLEFPLVKEKGKMVLPSDSELCEMLNSPRIYGASEMPIRLSDGTYQFGNPNAVTATRMIIDTHIGYISQS